MEQTKQQKVALVKKIDHELFLVGITKTTFQE